MPLTERPGVFRGRLNDVRRWYVVDPERDAQASEQAWRAHAATTNRPGVLRILRTLATVGGSHPVGLNSDGPAGGVREVPRDVVARAGEDTSREALWEITSAFTALSSAATDAVLETWQRSDWDRSESAAVTLDRLSPEVREDWEGAVARFARVAREHGFPVRDRELDLVSYTD